MENKGQISAVFKFIAVGVPGILVLAGVLAFFFCGMIPEGFSGKSLYCNNYIWFIIFGVVLWILEIIFYYGFQ